MCPALNWISNSLGTELKGKMRLEVNLILNTEMIALSAKKIVTNINYSLGRFLVTFHNDFNSMEKNNRVNRLRCSTLDAIYIANSFPFLRK